MIAEKEVPLLDLKSQHARLRPEIVPELMRVIDSQKFILGEEVERFEAEIASYCGARFAVGCASGSDALSLALLASDIGPGDEVLTTPYTFFATAGAISRLGATPVFADVEPHTFNLDMNRVEEALQQHPRIKAIIPVHLFGGAVEMDTLLALASTRGLIVIEDAAQSIGSEYKNRRVGGIGDIGCFSFFPSKNLGCYGDGGLMTTNNDETAKKLKALRVHGRTGKYLHQWIGVNSRLDALQAAVLRVKLKYLDSWSNRRRQNAEVYRQKLAGIVEVPREQPYQNRHVYNQFIIRCERRDQLQAHLKQRGIGSEVYYPLPLHLQPCYAELGGKKGDFPVSEVLAESTLALPIHSELSQDDLDYVIETISEFYR